MKTRVLALLGVSLAALAATPAMAYNVSTCIGVPVKWSTNGPAMNASPVSFPAGYWFDGMQRTINLFNQNPTPFFFSLAVDAGGVGLGNGVNETWGSTDAGVLGGAPAIAYWWDTCFFDVFQGVISYRNESDVIFDYNAPFQWTADELKSSIIMYTGTQRQLQSTGTHEFGHAAGLLHEADEYNIMGADFEHIWANGSSARGYLGEDAADGLTFLYGLWGVNWQDLGAVHWKYSFADGEYSRHVKTAVYSSAGILRPTVLINGEVGYKVKRGKTVQVEFTYENNGETSQTVNTGWYISTNDLISRTDRLISSVGMTLSRGDVFTYRQTLTIPANLRPGNYWLGTIVDMDSAVPDAVSDNNATYIPIHVNK